MHDGLLKVLIVDDEHLVRNLLRHCLDWEEIGTKLLVKLQTPMKPWIWLSNLGLMSFLPIFICLYGWSEFGRIV